MGYDVSTSLVFGFYFNVDLADSSPVIFENLEDIDEEEEMYGDWKNVLELRKLAVKYGLDIEATVDGERSSTDAVAIGIKFNSATASGIQDAIKRFNQVCTPDVVNEIMAIMGEEPTASRFNDSGSFRLDNQEPITHEPEMHCMFNKSW